MAMEINGAAVLGAIATSPAVFSFSTAQLNALAMTVLIARLKDKAVLLDDIKSIAHAIGQNDFRLALDHLAPKDVAALTKRLDPKHPDLRTSAEAWHREQIWKLAEGSVEPAIALPRTPARSISPPKAAGSKTGDVMKSKALKAKAPPPPRARAKKP